MQGIVGICHECGSDGKKDRKIVEKEESLTFPLLWKGFR
jgi:hypothetical protein